MAGKADKDTHRSRQRVSVLLATSEGDITEVSRVLLGEVGIEGYSAAFAYTLGGVNQLKIPGFDVVGGAVSQQTELTALTLGGAINYKELGPFNYEVEYVDVTITCPEGVYWHTAADNIRVAQLDIAVWTSINGTAWVLKNQIINGHPYQVFRRTIKSLSPYAWKARIERPANATGQWYIRLRRITTDATEGGSTDSYFKTKTNFSYQSYQNVEGATYAGTALLAVRIEDASEFNNSIPKIAGYGKGLKMKVPEAAYYNAGERAYYPAGTGTSIGTWSGSFNTTTQYTNCLAWVLYNLKSDALKKNIPTTEVLTGAAIITKTASSIATVSLTNHGLITNNFVQILAELGFNRTRAIITRIDDNTFTYDTLVDGTATINSNITISKWITEEVIVGEGVPEAYMAKYTFNTFANYCDELVNGEFRYSVNGQFVERVGSTEFLNSLLSIGNASFAEINGLVSIVYDKKLLDADIIRTPILVNENVDEGIFEYSESNLSETYTQINVTIQDANDFNKTKTVIADSSELMKYLRDNSLLATYGIPTNATDDYFIRKYAYNPKDITLQGVTTDYMAVRKGRGLLWDSLLNNQFVNFKTAIEGATFYRGQVIRTLDSDDEGTQETGRISSYTSVAGTLTLTLDREVTLGAGTNYIFFYKNASVYDDTALDGTEVHKQLVPQRYTLNETSITTTTVTVTTTDIPNVIDTNIPESIFVIQSSNLRTWTIISNHFEENKYITLCMRYDPVKFNFVESNYTQPTTNYASIRKIKLNKVLIRDVDIVTFADVITASVIYADEAARLADLNYVPADIGTIAQQTTPLTYWALADVVLGTPNVITWRQTSITPIGTGVITKSNELNNGNVIISFKWNHDDTDALASGRIILYEVAWENDVGDSGTLISYTKSADLLYKIPTNETSIIFTFKLTAKAALAFDSIVTTIVKEYNVANNQLIDQVGLVSGES